MALAPGQVETSQVSRSARRGWRHVADSVVGSDPGLNQLRTALSAVGAVGLAIAAEYLFVKASGALQTSIPSGAPPGVVGRVAALNHASLVTAIVIGAIVAIVAALAVTDPAPRGQLATLLWFPLPLIGGLAVGIELRQWRVLSLTIIVIVLMIGAYLRGYGPRWLLAGVLLFLGYLTGFVLGASTPIGDVGWLAAEIGVGLIAVMAVKLLVVRADPTRALRRTRRSLEARLRSAVQMVATAFEQPGGRSHWRLQRRLVRVNEAALMIDASLSGARASAHSAKLVRQRLFDLEHALSELAALTEAMAGLDLPFGVRSAARQALTAAQDGMTGGAREKAREILGCLDEPDCPWPATSAAGPDPREISGEFAASVLDYADASQNWSDLDTGVRQPQQPDTADTRFIPGTKLFAGWLPGTAIVSARASLATGIRSGPAHVRLKPNVRAAIQIGVAGGLAVIAADARSPQHLFWAILAVFLVFFGTNNSGEQVARAVAGIIVSTGVVLLSGHSDAAAIVVVLISVFLGSYLLRINNAFLVAGITIALSELYVQFNEYSNGLLLLRLEETAIGVGIAGATVILVLPLYYTGVLRVALAAYVRALSELLSAVADALPGPSAVSATGTDLPLLRTRTRAMDAAYQALLAAAGPLSRHPLRGRREKVRSVIAAAGDSHQQAGALAATIPHLDNLDERSLGGLTLAAHTMQGSLAALLARIDYPGTGIYTRSTALLDDLSERLPLTSGSPDRRQRAVHDLRNADAAMARLAVTFGMPTDELDLPSPASTQC